MKKVFVAALVVMFCLNITGLTFGAEEKKGTGKAPAVTAATAAARPAAMRPARANFGVVFGTISKIDTSDPQKPKLEVKSEIDNTTHIIEATPATNVTKATDFSELKTGDSVRVLTRKAEDKEVAVNVMFGKITKPTRRSAMRSATLQQTPATAPTKK